MKVDTRRIGIFFKRNSHIIAGALAIFGVGFTTYNAVKAGTKIGKKLEEAEKEKGEPLTFKEKVPVVAPELTATAIGAAGTVTAITLGAVGAEACIGALAAGMTTTMKKYADFQQAVAEVDPKAADKANKVVAQAVISENPYKLEMDDDDILYYDSLTETEFVGKPGLALRAANRLRSRLSTMGYFTVSDYVDALGIPACGFESRSDYCKVMAWDQFSFVKHGRYPTMELGDLMAHDGLEIFEEVMIDDNDTLERHYIWPSHDPDVNLLDKDCTRIISRTGPRE